jgi:hypothetical protein
VDLALDRAPQQRMPGRVELDLVDPVAVAVVRAEDRRVALGAPAVLERLDAARERACLARPVDAPSATLPLEPLAQGEVDLEQVDRLERWRLVQDLARGVAGISVNRDSQRLSEAPRAAAHPVEPDPGRALGRMLAFGGVLPLAFKATGLLFTRA